MDLSFHATLKSFIAAYKDSAFLKSSWFEDYPRIKVYLRVGSFLLRNQGFKSAIVVANVSVFEQERGNGHYRNLLACLEKTGRVSGFDCLVIENVMNPQHHRIYTKRGFALIDEPPIYTLCPTLSTVRSFVKLL